MLGFNLLKTYPLISSQPTAPKIDELIKMDRATYTAYVKSIENNKQIELDYIDQYKTQLLRIHK